MVMGFVVMVIWMLPHLNPIAKKEITTPPGNMIISITWPYGNIDVDLWVYGPTEDKPIGYSNKSGVLFDLLRDDLGFRPDYTPLNFETTYSRGLLPGEYIINIHCYRCPLEDLPMKVSLEVSINTPKNKFSNLYASVITLMEDKEEKTAIRFKLDDKNKVVAGSMNHIFIPLRGLWLEDNDRFQ
jgi:hypothetical protein